MLGTCMRCDRKVDADTLLAVDLIETETIGMPLEALDMSTPLAAADDRLLVSCEMWCLDCRLSIGDDS
jgi:hypothetical protein